MDALIGTAELFWIVVGAIIVVALVKGIKIVPHQQAWIVEKLGKFDRSLDSGLHFIIPFIENIAYKHSLKEEAIDVSAQRSITKDNVSLVIDGVIYVKILDPIAASYGVSDPYYAIIQLAQTTMRSEIGKIDLDKTFEERENMNSKIVDSINEASANWGIQCMRYELQNIEPPENVIKAMELQVAAERQKRANVLESEGKRQSEINLAEAKKQQLTLESEGYKNEKINHAEGEAEAIKRVAEATAQSITTIAESLKDEAGKSAVSLKMTEKYIEAFSELAKTNNTMIIPSNSNDAASMVSQALGIYNHVNNNFSETSESGNTNQSN